MSPNRVSLLYMTSQLIGAARRSGRGLCRPNCRGGRQPLGRLVAVSSSNGGRLSLLGTSCIVLLFLASVLPGPNAFGQQRPNILLILPDQLRAAGIGCMGNPDVRTPY